MRKILIAATSGLALAATLLFAATTGNAAPAPTSHTQTVAGPPVCC
ncbi:hypothetical protein ACPC54_33240 [Kitasatospora sp. NPDC094028]